MSPLLYFLLCTPSFEAPFTAYGTFYFESAPLSCQTFPFLPFSLHSPFDDAPAHQAVTKPELILETNRRPTAISLFYSETRTHGLIHREHPAHLWFVNSSLVVSAVLLLLLLQKERDTT